MKYNWYKSAQEQENFNFYNNVEKSEKPNNNEYFKEWAKNKGLTPQLLSEIFEEAELSNVCEIQMLLNQFGFDWEEIKLKDNRLIVISFPSENYVIDDFEDPEPEDVDRWLGNIFDHGLYDYIEYGDFNQTFWDEVEDYTSFYHATQPENKASILKDGISPMDKSRGISNRSTGNAVFTSDDPDFIEESYGSLIFEIHVGQMKQDGYMPSVNMEQPFEDVRAREQLAHAIGVKDCNFSSEYASEGLYENTIVFYGPIPAKYLTIYSE